MWKREWALVAIVVACRAKHDTPDTLDVEAPPPIARATASASSSASPRDASALEAVDRAAFLAYRSALVRGRQATLAKDWATAKGAFTDALRARPNDKRALAERGYAELLAGDSSDAQTDLEAARFADDKALAAQAWFNLGLLGEQHDGGASDDTLADFWFSNQLHPSTAARAKIAGRSICPVTVDMKHVAAKHTTSWLAVVKMLSGAVDAATCAAPKTEAEAKALSELPGLTVGAQGTFFVVRSASLDTLSCMANDTSVVQASGSDFWVYPSAGQGAVAWMLPTQPTVTLARFDGRVRATTTMSWPEETIMCSAGDASNEIFPCRGDPGEETAGMSRAPTPPDYDDFFFDPTTHELVLRIEDQASGRFGFGGRAITLRPDGNGVAVSGLGCARTFPFSR
jgi:hypothetical protein